MRNRNNRIAVRVTNKEFDRINAMASKSIFSKEQMIRIIVEGYPIQEKPSDDCMQLLFVLRKLATDMGTFMFQVTETKETSNLVFETIRNLIQANYISYGRKRKKKKGVKL